MAKQAARHCEERSDEAIQESVRPAPGLLRFARNDSASNLILATRIPIIVTTGLDPVLFIAAAAERTKHIIRDQKATQREK